MASFLTKICSICKEPFKRVSSETVDYFLNRKVFCSRLCYHKSRIGLHHGGGDKISLAHKLSGLRPPSNKDKHFSEEHKKNLSIANIGKVHSEEVKKKLSEIVIERYKLNPILKKQISDKLKNICRKSSDKYRTSLNTRIRSSTDYKEWRAKVFKRDSYTCQDCKVRNGNGETVYLEAHHILPFAYFREFRFNIDNGITLCMYCHAKVDKYRAETLIKELVG